MEGIWQLTGFRFQRIQPNQFHLVTFLWLLVLHKFDRYLDSVILYLFEVRVFAESIKVRHYGSVTELILFLKKKIIQFCYYSVYLIASVGCKDKNFSFCETQLTRLGKLLIPGFSSRLDLNSCTTLGPGPHQQIY